jgi:aristolochene synthase
MKPIRLLSALMRFSMGLSMTPEELNSVKDVDVNCAKHISVINDIFSWDKELLASRTGHQEGSALCSSVQVLAEEAHLSTEASKRILFNMCREWELCHMELVAKRKREVGEGLREEVMRYMDGLEYQMSGNELWSQSTLRYIGVIAE